MFRRTCGTAFSLQDMVAVSVFQGLKRVAGIKDGIRTLVFFFFLCIVEGWV